MARFRRSVFFVFVCFIFSSCGSRPDDNPIKHTPIYEQNFKSDIAWVVLEWNGKPENGGWGSGFLVNKEKGAFYTNKHVGDVFNQLGRGSHKILFNGKVYNGVVVKTDILVDVALMQITDPFDSSEFPDPAPFAEEKVKVGDRVFVEGFHVHPYRIREKDIAEGYDFPLVPIFKSYYRLGTKNLDQEQEVVFERLEAEVTGVDKKTAIQGQGTGIIQSLRNESNLYIEIKTLKDHKFSFGGLSGTVVRNNKRETIGIFTAGPEEEYDPIAQSQDGFVLLKQVYRTANITPIEAVAKLKDYLK